MNPGIRTNGPASLELVHMAGIEESVKAGLLEVKSVHTVETQRRQGHASNLMALLCKEADQDGTILVLTPARYGNGPLGRLQLQRWYEAFGFKVIQDMPVLMCRDPLAKAAEIAEAHPGVATSDPTKCDPAKWQYDIETDTMHKISKEVQVGDGEA